MSFSSGLRVVRRALQIEVPQRSLFTFFRNHQQKKEAAQMTNLFVDPLSKSELKYIPERNVYLAEEIGVEYSIRDGIYVMSPHEATLIVNDKDVEGEQSSQSSSA